MRGRTALPEHAAAEASDLRSGVVLRLGPAAPADISV
jgi:hypothetical protein